MKPDLDRCETPFGTLYTPKSFGVQIPFLIVAFAGGPAVAWLVSELLGGVSNSGQILLFVAYSSIFFLGYALWASRLAALAFNTFGRQLLRVLLQWFVKRKKPEGIEQLLPSREKLQELVVRAQRAASSFLMVAVPVGLISGAAAMLLRTQTSTWLQTVFVTASCISWGWLLTFLGRRGYLPLPEARE